MSLMSLEVDLIVEKSFLTKIFWMFKSFFGSKSGESETQNQDIKLNLNQPPQNENYRLPYFYPGSIIFTKNDPITGNVVVPLINGRGYHHLGIFLSIIGQNRIKTDNTISPFYKRTKQLAKEGDITEQTVIEFSINKLDYPVPSFYGTFADSRYTFQVRIKLQKSEQISNKPIYLLFTEPRPAEIQPLKAEVGIQNVLHVEFVIQNPIFDCGSVILGKVHFLIVKIRIVNLYIQIRRIESFNNGVISFKNEILLCQYELLDGMPVRGDWIPIRFYMPNIKAWPYPENSGRSLDVSYNIRFLLVDENGKHYFKDLAQSVTRFAIESN